MKGKSQAFSLLAIGCILCLVFGTVAFVIFKIQGEVHRRAADAEHTLCSWLG